MPTQRKYPPGSTILGLTTILGLALAMPSQAAAPQDEITAVIRKGSLEQAPNPVVLELLLAKDLHRLDSAQRARAEEQVIEGLRQRTLVSAFDSLGAMMSSTKEVMKAQFRPKNLLRNTLGLGGDGQAEANQIMGKAIVGPWVRGLAAAGTLAEAGYVADAAAFYQRCLGEPLLAGPGDGESLGSDFGQWVRGRCQKELVDLGVAVAGPVFSDLAAGDNGQGMAQSEGATSVAQAAGLSGLGALLEQGKLDFEQRKAVVDAALAVLDQPKKKLDDALASAAATVLGATGLPQARDALLRLKEQAKGGRFKLGRGSDLAGAARAAELALARGFGHRPSLDSLQKELLGGKGDWDAFETLFDLEEPTALTWARQQLEQMKTRDPATWAEPLIERLGLEGGPLALEALHDAEPVTVPTDDYVQAKLAVTLFENGERQRLPALAAAIERESWNLGGSAVRQGARLLKPLAKVVARQALGLPVPQGPSDRMLVDFAFGAADAHDRQQEAEATAVRKMRLRVATALSTWDDPQALPLIARLFAVGDEAVRIAAARALIGQTSPSTVPVLLAALDADYGMDDDEPRAPEIQAALLIHAGRTFGADPPVRANLAGFDRFEHDSVRFVAAAMAMVGSGERTAE